MFTTALTRFVPDLSRIVAGCLGDFSPSAYENGIFLALNTSQTVHDLWVRIINAAAMQALASDKGKRMLLLGFGNRLMGPRLPAVWPQD
jgi:hypothetical protein